MAAGIFWIAGAFVEGTPRTVLWLVALGIDYSAPLATFWVPGREHLRHADWRIGTGHFAERFQLFVILALGESIVITGAATSELDLARCVSSPSPSPFSARRHSGGSISRLPTKSASAASNGTRIGPGLDAMPTHISMP